VIEVAEDAIDGIRAAPANAGRVELIVGRPDVEEREVYEEAQLDPAEGLVGDNWRERSIAKKGVANPDTQLTLVNARAAAVFAGPRERWALAGDQLYVDLDLSERNLPPGTRLRLGSAVIEITAEPHLGCGKFIRRFGIDAQKWVNSDVGRELKLRGIYARIVQAGTVRTGDEIAKLDAG
jgi:MOSC domain-containing protein YiiM